MTQTKSKSENRIELSTPVRYLKGVGPAKAMIFAQLGVGTAGELLEYFPRDWVFAPKAVKINQIREGETATIIGIIESTDIQNFRRPAIFEAMVADEAEICRVVWFHGGYLCNQLKPGMKIMVSGSFWGVSSWLKERTGNARDMIKTDAIISLNFIVIHLPSGRL